MRGSPLFTLAILFIILLLACIPIWLLTHQDQKNDLPEEQSNNVQARKWIDIVLTSSVPGFFSVKSLDHTILENSSPLQSLKGRIQILSTNPDDLVITAKWENSLDPHALRVEIKDNEESLIDTTFWGNESLQEVLTFR